MPHPPGARPPLVSVVLPCRVASSAQLALLDATLRSVAAQSCSDHEVIVVDDGSTVDVSGVAGAYRRAFLVRQPHGGSAMARNAGIDVARGGAFVFLEAGDHLPAESLAAGVALLESAPTCGFVVGTRAAAARHDGEPAGELAEAARLRWARRLYLRLLGGDCETGPPTLAIVRREVVLALGGFRDPWGADDLDFYLRAAWLFDGRCLHAAMLRRERRGGGAPLDAERRIESARAVYERQWPLVQGHPDGEAAWEAGLRRFTEPFGRPRHDRVGVAGESFDERLLPDPFSSAIAAPHVRR